MRLRRTAALGAALVAVLTSAACTGHSGPTPTPSVSTSTIITTRTVGVPTGPSVAPVATGPTTSAAAKSCPFVSEDAVHQASGLRLDKITVLLAGGGPAGCIFYPLGHPTAECGETCFKGEHLPPASQPAIEIRTLHYASAREATAAVAGIRAHGTNAQPLGLRGGVCYQTSFYAKDHGTDWSCAFSSGTRVVLVDTVTVQSADAVGVTKAVAKAF